MGPVFVWLCGLSGSGKSTVGPLLAARIGAPFCNLDDEIAREAGMAVAEIFAREGEAGFRAREARALGRVLCGPPAVVALGGGALVRPENLSRVLEAGRLVWLDAPTEVLVSRLSTAAARPLLAPHLVGPEGPAAALERLRAARAAAYGRAGLRLETTLLEPDQAAARIAVWLARPDREAR